MVYKEREREEWTNWKTNVFIQIRGGEVDGKFDTLIFVREKKGNRKVFRRGLWNRRKKDRCPRIRGLWSGIRSLFSNILSSEVKPSRDINYNNLGERSEVYQDHLCWPCQSRNQNPLLCL